MGAEKDIIVAIELGSTAIRAIAGKREPDGTMQILAFAQENAANSIRKGIIDNIDKTTQAISKVVGQLNDRLNIYVNRVYIGLAGQSLHTVQNKVFRQFDGKIQISPDMVDQLKDINLGEVYTDSRILDVVPQEYGIGNRNVAEPVGMLSEQIEARFMNVIARNSLYENIEKCVKGAGLDIAEILISPICLADALLSASEKRSGCSLVDIGADTTTVSVYTQNTLRHLAVIPLGSANVTADIASRSIEMEEADKLKLDYGTAYHTDDEDQIPRKIQLKYEQSITEDVLQEIVEARYEEIIKNVWAHISKESDNLLSGIVLTGGGSRVKNLTKAFTEHTHCNKPIRIAKGLPLNITTARNINIPENNNFYTLMALLLKGDQNCVSEVPLEKEAVQTEISFDGTEKKAEETNTEETSEPKPKKEKNTSKKVKNVWEKIKIMLMDEEDYEKEEDNKKTK